MKCKRCKNQAVHDGSCRRCYLMVLEKRVRKDMRMNKIVSPRMKVRCKDKLSEILLRRIMKSPVSIVKHGADLTLEKWTKDDEIHDALTRLFIGKEPNPGSRLSILRTLTDEEACKLADILEVGWSPRKKKDDIRYLIDKMSESYGETRHSLYNAIEEMKMALQ